MIRINSVVMAIAYLISACGADVTGRKFREEKDDRIDAELKLGDTRRVNDVLKELISNMTQSNSLQWIYDNSQTGVPVETYEKAAQVCNEVGFSLPTKAQLQGEGATVRGIKNISGNLELPAERMVYVKDDVTDGFRFILCVREIPAS